MWGQEIRELNGRTEEPWSGAESHSRNDPSELCSAEAAFDTKETEINGSQQ